MKLRLLVVEDNPDDFEVIREHLESPRRTKSGRVGVSGFVIEHAISVSGAIAMLAKAASSGEPYDIMLLDLKLPRDDKDTFVGADDAGLEVLKEARRLNIVRAVVVLSIFTGQILSCFRGGIHDFVAKRNIDTLMDRLLLCWEAVLQREFDCSMLRRLRLLAPHGERALGYRFGNCLSGLAQAIQTNGQRLREEIRERHGLGSEGTASDPLFEVLGAIDNASLKADLQWKEQMEVLDIWRIKEPEALILDGKLDQVYQEVIYPYMYQRVELVAAERTGIKILGFSDDIVSILREITLGAIVELERSESQQENLSVTVTVVPQQNVNSVAVVWEDNLPTFDSGIVSAINRHFSIAPGERFGRAWGLSIAQHIAVRGTGRILVERGASTHSNVVKFILPTVSQ